MLLKILRGSVHVSGHVLPIHMEMDPIHSCHGWCIFKVRQLCTRRISVILKCTLVVDGVRLQREERADGDDVERQGEVGHAELAQKVAEGAAQVDAERISNFSLLLLLSLPRFHNEKFVHTHA